MVATELTVDSHPLHLLELWFPRQWRHTFLVDSTNMAMVCDGYQAGDGTPAYPEVTPVDLRDVDTFLAVNILQGMCPKPQLEMQFGVNCGRFRWLYVVERLWGKEMAQG